MQVCACVSCVVCMFAHMCKLVCMHASLSVCHILCGHKSVRVLNIIIIIYSHYSEHVLFVTYFVLQKKI